MWTVTGERQPGSNLMSWRRTKTTRRSSSMSFPCVVWLLAVCLAAGGQGQGQPEPDAQPATSFQLEEKDVSCHPEGCYAVFLQRRTFREAGRSCRERGGTLATMHDHEKAGLIHDLLLAVKSQGTKTRFRLWIGLHRPPRQCSSTRPLRGFVWVTGDHDGKFTNWLREESRTPGTCAAPRCVAVAVQSESTTADNLKWLDGSCGLAQDGYVCQFNYRGMCPPLTDEGQGPAVYTTPFHLVSSVLTHVPFGSVAEVKCPADAADPSGETEETVLCMERDDETVGWSRDAPLCSADGGTKSEDWCGQDHGCEQFCQNTDTDYYCYCSEGFTLDEDGYGCRPDPLSQTDPPELSSDSAGPTEAAHVKEVCLDMGCEYDCAETARGMRCTCPHGFQMARDGRKCLDVDECQQHPCPQVCVNIPGTFHCTCDAGYQPDDDGECVDVDECLDEGSCDGTCENTVGSFRCSCDPGYAPGPGGECADVDECVGESPCQQQCLNYMGGYQCYCDQGYDLQADGLTCEPSPEDGEYSTLTPDPSDAVQILDLDADHVKSWSGSFTPNPNFESNGNFDTQWLTEAPNRHAPDVRHGSENHLNQWDAVAPKRYQTVPPPTQKGTSNEIDQEAEAKSKVAEADAPKGAASAEVKDSGSETGGDVSHVAGVGGGSDAGGGKSDKSWLLVALLVPLCVFLVVMLALGIVYCTSCAVDKSLSFSNCHRWILPTTPPSRGDGKTPA